MCTDTSHPAPPHHGKGASHLPLVGLHSRVPGAAPPKGVKGRQSCLWGSPKAPASRWPSRQAAAAAREEGGPPWNPAPMTPTSAGCG